MSSTSSPRSFQTTRWSVVRRAAGTDDAAGRAALGALCRGYWFPIYAFIRRSGKSPHDAEDSRQGFFARLLERGILAHADPAKGKLRTYLLACVRHYLADEHERAQARKRGAGLVTSFDAIAAEGLYAAEPVDHLTPDRLFQRRWALALLEETLGALSEEQTAQAKAAQFAVLRPFLGFGTGQAKSYEELAVELGLPVGTLKNHVFRLRQRWRALLLDRVAATLDNPTEDDIKTELSELLNGV